MSRLESLLGDSYPLGWIFDEKGLRDGGPSVVGLGAGLFNFLEKKRVKTTSLRQTFVQTYCCPPVVSPPKDTQS